MMKSPIMRLIFVISLWLCVIAALHVGLVAMNYNIVEMILSKIGLGGFYLYLQYILGIAGIFGLIMLLMELITPGSCIKD